MLAENNHLYFGNSEDQLAKHLLNAEKKKKKAALLSYLQDIFCLLLLEFSLVKLIILHHQALPLKIF